MKTFKDIDSYIASFPKEVQAALKKMRATIKKAAPKAEQKMGYGIPTFTLEGKNLVHFGGFKSHIGFFPASSGIAKFAKDISKYKHSKGTVQFPLDRALPLGLVTKIVKFRVKENLAIAKAKAPKNKDK